MLDKVETTIKSLCHCFFLTVWVLSIIYIYIYIQNFTKGQTALRVSLNNIYIYYTRNQNSIWTSYY